MGLRKLKPLTLLPSTVAKLFKAGTNTLAQVNAEPNLVAGNIATGKSIYGVGGNVQPKLSAQGTGTADSVGRGSVNGLAFQPNFIVLRWGTYYRKIYHPPSAFTVNLYYSGQGYFDKSSDDTWVNGGGGSSGIAASYFVNNPTDDNWTVTSNSFISMVGGANQSFSWWAYQI